MDHSTQSVTPLRQRMIDDMRMRKLSDKTQTHYLRAVRQLAKFLPHEIQTGISARRKTSSYRPGEDDE